MPKVSKLQSSFSAGEVSPLVYGRVEAPRYKAALATCLNYIPTLQGPAIRRPGTKYVAGVKDPTKPPALIPFQYSASQAYILEFGDLYVRFYANGGQVITNTTVFKVAGTDSYFAVFGFKALRSSPYPMTGETVTSSSVVTSGSIMELVSPYSQTDVAKIKWAQTANTLYLTHPNYPPYKFQRRSSMSWEFKQVQFRDGPYLPLNSYAEIGDQVSTWLIPNTPGIGGSLLSLGSYTTGPVIAVSSVISAGSSGLCRVIAPGHGHQTGDQIVITGIVGTSEANNYTSSIPQMSWSAQVVDANTIDLPGSAFVHAYVGSGAVYPAMFQSNPLVPGWVDVGRSYRFSAQAGSSVWGYISSVVDMKEALFFMYPVPVAANMNSSAIKAWQLGSWSNPILPNPNYPSACSFHQNRLFFTGAPNAPQDINGSMVGDYEAFSANNIDTLAVTAKNALQFTLNSQEVNTLKWLKSTAQGLLAGSHSTEWAISPSVQQDGLTPTNFNAVQASFYGSADVDAVQIGNGTLYVNRTGRKVREMNYFFQLGTFRSSDLTELAEHLTIPAITKLAVQKDTQPIIWALNSSGVLLSMVYNRDDMSLQAGWAPHRLGGQSDSAGTQPKVSSFAVIPSQDVSFDQLWLVTNRWINGSSKVQIECMTKVFDDSVRQDDAFQLDCGFTYDSPVTITGLTNAAAAIVTASTHGFSNGNQVKVTNVVGLNVIQSSVVTANLVNEHVFQVGSSLTNSFFLLDVNTNAPINTNSSSVYVSGGQARKLITHVSGLNVLANETIGVWADGGAHPDITVNSSGLATLSYAASKVQFGYRYNSDGATLSSHEGSAQGSAVGSIRRVNRFAFLLHNVGDLQVGTNFDNLIPMQLLQADQILADQASPLFSGMLREGVESGYDITDTLCFRQNSPAPGMIQSLTLFLEEQDV